MTGLYFYNARYYDPEIGRFISADTVVMNFANPQGFNRYAYVLNNPLKYIDPTGLWGESLDDPAGEGSLGWTSAEGWLIGIGGEWIPIGDSAVNTMVSKFGESTTDTWSEFAQQFGLPIASKKALSYTWGSPSGAGGNRYSWRVEQRYDRGKDIALQRNMEPSLTLVEQYQLWEFTRHDYADALRTSANFIETTDPFVSNIPPEYIIGGAGLLGIGAPVAGLIALGTYGAFGILPDVLSTIAYWIDY